MSSQTWVKDQGTNNTSLPQWDVIDMPTQDLNANEEVNRTTPYDMAPTTSESFTPEQQESLDEPGAWAAVERFTIIPGQAFDDADFEASLCTITASANSLAMIKVTKDQGVVRACSRESESSKSYGTSYLSYQVERLLHLAGERTPLRFEVKHLSGPTSMEEDKTYIIGLRIIDGSLFSNGYIHEVIPYDETSESSSVNFSGKREALIATGNAQLADFESQCAGVVHFASDESFRMRYLDSTKCGD